jgi:hypothetical protein
MAAEQAVNEMARSRATQLQLVNTGAELVDRAYRAFSADGKGMPEMRSVSSLSFDELKRLAYAEKYNKL